MAGVEGTPLQWDGSQWVTAQQIEQRRIGGSPIPNAEWNGTNWVGRTDPSVSGGVPGYTTASAQPSILRSIDYGGGYTSTATPGDGNTVASPGAAPTASPYIDLSREAYERQQQTQLQADLQRQAEERRLAALRGIAGATSATVPGPTGPAANEEAARAAAFARAKDQAGQVAQSAQNTVNDVMAARGLHGSSIEANALAGGVGKAQDVLNDFTRSQLIEDLNRAADVGDMTYQGNITMRGQDLNRQQALLGLIAGQAY